MDFALLMGWSIMDICDRANPVFEKEGLPRITPNDVALYAQSHFDREKALEEENRDSQGRDPKNPWWDPKCPICKTLIMRKINDLLLEGFSLNYTIDYCKENLRVIISNSSLSKHRKNCLLAHMTPYEKGIMESSGCFLQESNNVVSIVSPTLLNKQTFRPDVPA